MPSMSMTAHMCCMQMSGMARLSMVVAPVCDPHHEAVDGVGFDAVGADKLQQRVERRLDRRADGPALDVRVHDLVAAAEAARQLRGIPAGWL